MQFKQKRHVVKKAGDKTFTFQPTIEVFEDYDDIVASSDVNLITGETTEELKMTYDSGTDRYIIDDDGTAIPYLIQVLRLKPHLELELDVKDTISSKNEIEKGKYKVTFYFEDEFGVKFGEGIRYLGIGESYSKQYHFPQTNKQRILTDPDKTNELVDDESFTIKYLPFYSEFEQYRSFVKPKLNAVSFTEEMGQEFRILSSVQGTQLRTLLIDNFPELTENIFAQNYTEDEILEQASITIGSGENGEVTVTFLEKGQDKNGIPYQVTVSDESDAEMSVQYNHTGIDTYELDIVLGTEPWTPQSQTIGSGDSEIEITTVDTGTDMNDYTVGVVEGVGNDVDMSAVLTDSNLVITLGTDSGGALDPSKNASDLVAAAIEQSGSGTVFTATQAGTNPLTAQEGPHSFTGGTQDVPDATKNTAKQIAEAIELLMLYNKQIFTTEYSGTGETALDSQDSGVFQGGVGERVWTLKQQSLSENTYSEEFSYTGMDQLAAVSYLESQTDFTDDEKNMVIAAINNGYKQYVYSESSDWDSLVLMRPAYDRSFIDFIIDPRHTIVKTQEDKPQPRLYLQDVLDYIYDNSDLIDLQGRIYMKVEKMSEEEITYDTDAYPVNVRDIIKYMVRNNPISFVITEDDPIVQPVIYYDNTNSGLTSNTVQEAIDELKQLIDQL